ncbi:Protein FAM22D [Tupaia chinensis]|uniref:Protein FAM22D n=1 Tax=Tupaia chinensis TaxID=246437 RepID=L9JN97_TUPCH|nr:Protein FAM22D [Tupaia chinensis]
MSLEECLSQAMQEWQHTSNFDRTKYCEMAANVQCPQQGLPQVLLPSRAAQRLEANLPKEIPPEAMGESVDITESLLRFLSPNPEMDLMSLMEKLEPEEWLTPDQITPITAPAATGSQPQMAFADGHLDASQAKASLDDSCNPRSVYKNFQRWQRFKTLARSHLPQSPDGEALSCFFIPVLRSLSCLTPTMSLEEGLSQAMQEWQRTSSFDRRKYYEMAAKFMEFEAEEEMQIQQLQELNGSQYLPPVAPPKPDPPGLLIPEVIQEQGCSVPRKACLEATPSHLSPSRASQRPDPKGPKDIPPEVMQEYVDIMEGLLGYGGQWAQDAVQPGQEDGAFPDLGLLSYMEELCSQGEFVTKVEAVLHPQFLAELLSPKPGMDLLALMEELEQEDRLTPDQLVEKRLRALKEDRGEEAAPGPGAPILGSSNYKPVTSPDSERHDHGPYDRISLETHLPKKASQDSEEHHRGDADLLWPKDTDIFPGRVGPLPLSTTGPASPRQGHGLSHPCLGTRGASGGVGTSPVRRMCWPADGSSEDEEQLPSLAFFMASPHSLLPWVPALSPAPTAGHLHPGGCRPRGATKARSAHRRSLSSATHLPSKSKKRDVIGGSIPSSKKLKPQKRKWNALASGQMKKQLCGQ